VIQAIIEAKNDAVRKYDVDERDCAAKIKSKFSPVKPWIVNPGDSRTVTHSISLIEEGICAGPDTGFECKFRFTESGADLPPATVKFVNIKGCTK